LRIIQSLADGVDPHPGEVFPEDGAYFEAGMTIKELAERHGRTTGAIRTRLERLGKLTNDRDL
jgi:hypothetical protein